MMRRVLFAAVCIAAAAPVWAGDGVPVGSMKQLDTTGYGGQHKPDLSGMLKHDMVHGGSGGSGTTGQSGGTGNAPGAAVDRTVTGTVGGGLVGGGSVGNRPAKPDARNQRPGPLPAEDRGILNRPGDPTVAARPKAPEQPGPLPTRDVMDKLGKVQGQPEPLPAPDIMDRPGKVGVVSTFGPESLPNIANQPKADIMKEIAPPPPRYAPPVSPVDVSRKVQPKADIMKEIAPPPPRYAPPISPPVAARPPVSPVERARPPVFPVEAPRPPVSPVEAPRPPVSPVVRN